MNLLLSFEEVLGESPLMANRFVGDERTASSTFQIQLPRRSRRIRR